MFTRLSNSSMLSRERAVSYTHLDVYKRQVFAYFHTIPSLYLLYVFSWSITAVAEILYFIRIYKQKMALLS